MGQSIFFIRHETSYGPFFSSKKKAETYLRDQEYPECEEDLQDMLAGRHDYCNVVEVQLDDITRHFDG